MGSAFQILGNIHKYPGQDSGNDDTLILGPCLYCPIDGEVVDVSVLVLTAAGNIRVGIYADNGTGTPGALLGESASTAAVAGWMTIALTAPAALDAGDSFWIATLCDDNGLETSQEVDDNAGRGNELDLITTGVTFGALPDPWPGETTTGSRARAVFARVNPA